MRYRLPEDCAGISHAGVALDRAADGTIEAAETAAEALAPHGLVPIEDVPTEDTPMKTPPIDKTPRANTRGNDRRMLR